MWELGNALRPQHPPADEPETLLALNSLPDHVHMKRESCCIEGERKALQSAGAAIAGGAGSLEEKTVSVQGLFLGGVNPCSSPTWGGSWQTRRQLRCFAKALSFEEGAARRTGGQRRWLWPFQLCPGHRKEQQSMPCVDRFPLRLSELAGERTQAFGHVLKPSCLRAAKGLRAG